MERLLGVEMTCID